MRLFDEPNAAKLNKKPMFHTIDDFELGKPLGAGQFGQVWLVRHKAKGYILALKVLKKEEITSTKNTKQLRREIEIHQHLKHKNILRMYGYFYDKQRIYLILEYAGHGEVFRYLQIKGRFTEAQSARYIFQVSKALLYMHCHSVIHRDIKPENLLIGCDGQIKIADFGWAVRNVDKKRVTFCGTKEYLAPEMIDEENYDERLDLWCVGILCYEFLTGKTPFENSTRSIQLMRAKIMDLDYKFPEYVGSEARDFVGRLLVRHNRMKLEQIVTHHWIVRHVSPEERNSFFD